MDVPLAATQAKAESLQRAIGEAHLSVRRRDGRTVLDRLRQSGCLKARLPRTHAPAWTEAVLLNSSGGVAAGDQLTVSVDAQPDTRLTVTAQAAERFYRAAASDRPACLRNTLTIAERAAIEWLPQETILYDQASLDRKLTIRLTNSSRFIGVESIVFGRLASGETLQNARLRDKILIEREGSPIWFDTIRLNGPIAALLDRPAVGAGARAIATLMFVAPEAENALDTLRDALASHPVEAACSAWNGMLIARFAAPANAPLRAAILSALACLRGDRPMPRLWAC